MSCARVVLSLLLVPVLGGAQATTGTFDRFFVDATLRVDYHHSGHATSEQMTLDGFRREGRWAGSRTRLEDPSPVGGYRVTVRCPEDGSILYSQGYDSYFGEYRTTGSAAQGIGRTYHESVRVPYPKRPVNVEIAAHRRDGSVEILFARHVDPKTELISDELPSVTAEVLDHHVPGDPHDVLDIAILGEGYTISERETFLKDLESASRRLLSHAPFSKSPERIAVRGVFAPSLDSGCDEPTRGHFPRTALNASFNSLGSERYLLIEDNRTLREVAANAPYDALIVMVNHERYGGGGIYNLYCTFTAHNQWSPYLLMHEFGHSFAGLADEYYTSSVAYNDFYPRGREPVEPNITALLDPENLKWRHLVDETTQIPVQWEKEGFDTLDMAYQRERQEINDKIAAATRNGVDPEVVADLKQLGERRSREHAQAVSTYLSRSAVVGVVGAFEGAGYSSEGLYRPELDCLMFTKGLKPYCRVCSDAVEQRILRYTEEP